MTRLFNISIILMAVVIAITVGSCGRGHDSRLDRIEKQIGVAPSAVLTMLDSIDPAQLSRHDKALHALLTVKASDIAYIPHTSDSAINIALDYFSTDRSPIRRAETHYYKGRVGSDLFDYPTAMIHFTKAIKILDEETSEADTTAGHLKTVALSQHGQLLTNIHLYKESIPFFIKAAELDSIFGNTDGVVHNMVEVAFALNMLDKPDSAMLFIDRARKHFDKVGRIPQKRIIMENCRILFKEGRIDEARHLIAPMINLTDSFDLPASLSLAIMVYEAAGVTDSALNLARILMTRPIRIGSFSAARILSEDANNSLNPDSIKAYHDQFKEVAALLISHREKVDNLQGAMFYNHMLSEIDNVRLKSRNRSLTLWILLLSAVMAIGVSIVLFFLYRRSLRDKSQADAIVDLQHLVIERHATPVASPATIQPSQTVPAPDSMEVNDSRTQIISSLRLRMKEISEMEYSPDPEIINSDARIRFMDIVDGKAKTDDVSAALWMELDKVILKVTPNFKASLTTLLGKVTDNDYHISLLIRAGFTPTEISNILGRSKGTISNNRLRMLERIFDEKLPIRFFDGIIRSL